jgi:ADP-ribose pyrophosphatase YjhB (NUDIX family)
VLEETGLDVRPQEVLEVFDSIFNDGDGRTQYHYVLVDYRCSVTSVEARAGSDVSEVRWVTLEELAALQLRESIDRVLRKGLSASEPAGDPES